MTKTTYDLADLPFHIQRQGEEAILEVRLNSDNSLVALIDTSTSKQDLTGNKIVDVIGDRAEVIHEQLKKEGLV